MFYYFFFSSRRRHTSFSRDWSSTCALPISSSRWYFGTTSEGRFYLAMELVGGRTLAELIEDEAPRSEERRVGKECRCRREVYVVKKISYMENRFGIAVVRVDEIVKNPVRYR